MAKRHPYFWLIIALLALGIIYRLVLTANGNFIFNIDNARDMIDVREMVVLHKWRLTGPTSAIDGVYDGPAWYYLLAIPFLINNAPFSEIILMILLWGVGGYFLLKLTSRFGFWPMLASAAIWISSNFILLGTAYAFNPNPIMLLAPLLIYLLDRYLNNNSTANAISLAALAGFFFECEMNVGIFLPLIVLVAMIASGRVNYFKSRNFWLAIFVFTLFLIPQLIFDLKHQFIMSKSFLSFLRSNSGGSFNLSNRFDQINQTFFNVLVPTLMNARPLTQILIVAVIGTLVWSSRKIDQLKQPLLVSILSFILISYLGYILLPTTVNSWHLGGVAAVSIILISWALQTLSCHRPLKIISLVLSIAILIIAIDNTYNYFQDLKRPDQNPSTYRNELAVVDHIYQQANGQQFKVYFYLPSIIDYPYQYLVWWRGRQQYHYLPTDYAYAPNVPIYIGSKPAFSATSADLNRPDSHLIFLVMEPDRLGLRDGWEGQFKTNQFVSTENFGPYKIDTYLQKN